jgi:hypothetical protein
MKIIPLINEIFNSFNEFFKNNLTFKNNIIWKLLTLY